MQFVTVLEQVPRMVKTLEGLGPYLKDVDLTRYLSWFSGRRALTPWPLVAGAFGAGVVVGAGAALMASPKTGAELRTQLKSKLNTFAQQTRGAMHFRKTNGHGETTPMSESSEGNAAHI